jgi:hypothetical protein
LGKKPADDQARNRQHTLLLSFIKQTKSNGPRESYIQANKYSVLTLANQEEPAFAEQVFPPSSMLLLLLLRHLLLKHHHAAPSIINDLQYLQATNMHDQ